MMMNETMENDSDNCAFPLARGARVPLFHFSTPRAQLRRARGFTLIELMVVIVVICILAATTFKIMGNMETSDKIAQTKAKMAKVAMALEAYKAIYGKYPPVPVYNEVVGTKSDGSEDVVGQPCWFEFPSYDYEQYPNWDETAAGQVTRGDKTQEVQWGTGIGKCQIFTFGLPAFFLPRFSTVRKLGCQKSLLGLTTDGNGRVREENWGEAEKNHIFGQWQKHNRRRVDSAIEDSARDVAAARKILPYLQTVLGADGTVDEKSLNGWYDEDEKNSIMNVIGSGGKTERFKKSASRTLTTGGGSVEIPVCAILICDAWGKGIDEGDYKHHTALRYLSRPPYESYELRSSGPDHEFYNEDDIVIGSK